MDVFLFDNDKDMLKTYTELLFSQAMLIEGMNIDDPVEFSRQMCEIMSKA